MSLLAGEKVLNFCASLEQRRKRPFSDVRTAPWDCAALKCSSHRKDLGLRYSGSSSHHNDRYRWALELNAAILAIWLSTALNSVISWTRTNNAER